MQTGGYQGLERREKGKQLLNGYMFYFGGEENVLELDRGGGCTTLQMY